MGMYGMDPCIIISSGLTYSLVLSECGLSIYGPALNPARGRVAPYDRVCRTDHPRECRLAALVTNVCNIFTFGPLGDYMCCLLPRGCESVLIQ
eukprot:6193622-Pleurochrysis_carterae.AAC.2